MPDQPRFILGFGERLTAPVTVPRGGHEPVAPYDVGTARSRIASAVVRAAESADALPALACPGDEVVAAVTLHPTYLAKSYYPGSFLQAAGLEQVGSRPVEIVPEMVGRRERVDSETRSIREPGVEPRPSTEIFVATTRANLRALAVRLGSDEEFQGEDQLVRLENVHLPEPSSRVRLTEESTGVVALETVLHSGRPHVVRAFTQFAASVGVQVSGRYRFDAGGACFLAAQGERASVESLAAFSFLRVVRTMPVLRRPDLESVSRAADAEKLFLPASGPVDPQLRVAVLDGGVPHNDCLGEWITSFEFDDLGDEDPELVAHGRAVTSALLFGTIDPYDIMPRPYCFVDHYRVLDADDGSPDPFELYKVLGRIETVLRGGGYEYVNLSLGPRVPIEDDEIHSWTAVIDEALGDGRVFAAIAVGNDGHLDRALGLARIQPPSDCVNGLAVGAAGRCGVSWDRAPYSSIGPGRSPGLVKPDVLGFGGSTVEPFVVIGEDRFAATTSGTSFASPAVLRIGLGIRATFGPRMNPLAVKALLIHTAESHPTASQVECGWGRVQDKLSEIVLCGDGVVRVLYRGELPAGKFIRARLPVPSQLPSGYVILSATLCYASAVDSQDPGSYTRSGLDVTFRPHSTSIDPKSKSGMARSSAFFRQSDFEHEAALRSGAHKWETVLNSSRRMLATSLFEPVFDIHHNAREGGHAFNDAPAIPYAMVITVQMKRLPDIYSEVLTEYAHALQPLEPVVALPLEITTS